MKKLLLLAAFSAVPLLGFSQCTNLFFSEYLEGASNNKAVEIYNPTNATVNLTDYILYRYNNGSPTATDSLLPQGTLAPNAVFVAGNPSAIAPILAVSDTLHTITFFNGDDVLTIKHIPSNTVIDIIGIVGVDPGTNWPVGTGATSEFTLVRMVGVQGGELNWAIGATQYDVYPQNTTTFLGNHSMTPCCQQASGVVSSFTNVSCFGGNNGSATVIASGGNSFTYNWLQASSTTATASGLTAGLYDCIITNECGTFDTVSVFIDEPTALVSVVDSVVNPTCAQSNGFLSVTTSGGVSGYTYLWSPMATTTSISGLASGTYTCFTQDANGCIDTLSYILTSANPPTVTLSLTVADTACNFPTSLILGGESPAGGTWSGPGVTGNTFDPSAAGLGWAIISYVYTDSNNCSGIAMDSIFVEICIGVNTINSNTNWSVYPNPAQENVTIDLVDLSTIRSIALFDAAGRLVMETPATNNRNIINIASLDRGFYLVKLIDVDGQVLGVSSLVKE
ncbi:MAG: T9SS type A sorting domain-containing protein [Bacteroidia bacterium]